MIGPLLTRLGVRLVFPLPGGCAIGARPDRLVILQGLQAMGANVFKLNQVELFMPIWSLEASRRLKGSENLSQLSLVLVLPKLL